MPKIGRPPFSQLEDHQINWNFVEEKAPFGNNYTRTLKNRIVGGKLVPTTEDDKSLIYTPRSASKHPLAIHDTNRGNCEVTEDSAHTDKTPSTSLDQRKLPHHEVIPSIGQREEAATSFPELQSADMYPTRVWSIYDLLPKTRYLPEKPLWLTQDQYVELMKQTAAELSQGVTPENLREVYLYMTKFDRQLTGYALYQDVQTAFVKNKVFIPPQTLRLIACQYVSTCEDGRVNYEKILSFVSAALKYWKKDDGESGAKQFTEFKKPDIPSLGDISDESPRRVYYHTEEHPEEVCQGQESNSQSILRDRDDPRLLRDLEAVLLNHASTINMEAIRISFQRADRLHRGTLSEQQIKDICMDHRLPIPESVLDRVIHRTPHRGGGQYDWQEFVTFVERVVPNLRTGLFIPQSKMPADFARHYPVPASSWPHADEHTAGGGSGGSHHGTARDAPVADGGGAGGGVLSPRRVVMPPYETRETAAAGGAGRDAAGEGGHEPPVMHWQREVDERQRAEEATYREALRNEAHQTTTNERAYNSTQRAPAPLQLESVRSAQDRPTARVSPYRNVNTSPAALGTQRDGPDGWFNRFMKMAEKLYAVDSSCSGKLHRDRLAKCIDHFNEDFELGISRIQVADAIAVAQTHGAMVNIHDFLKRLSQAN